MSLSRTGRARIRRTLVASAAALTVCLLPTACDFTVPNAAGPVPAGHPAGHGGATAEPVVVVPVNNAAQEDEETAEGEAEEQAEPDVVAAPDAEEEQQAGEEEAAEGEEAAEEEVAEDEQAAEEEEAEGEEAAEEEVAEEEEVVQENNGLDVLGQDCTGSDLAPHTGFQESPACVSTSMGEIAAEDRLPSLLITDAPDAVGVGEDFELQVSTRNLVRDRFLGAAAGGYYLESSFLDDEGLQRGHFHTACRILPSTDEAPDASGAPAFFLATQDNGGGTAPDTVTIEVPGIDDAGELQCTSWAGDGSHRVPMMTRANQTPAIDSVRITVG